MEHLVVSIYYVAEYRDEYQLFFLRSLHKITRHWAKIEETIR